MKHKNSILIVLLIGLMSLLNFNNFSLIYAKSNNSMIESKTELTDEHISKILMIYHSQQDKNVCNSTEVSITQKDIAEFKEFYNEISAKANTYNHYFKSNTGWVNRSDGITLSCHYYPDAMFLLGNNPNAQAANVTNAFNLLKARHSSSSYWKNTGSMEAQFHCHALTIGKLKNPWNIEPWRTDSNLISVIAHGCNP